MLFSDGPEYRFADPAAMAVTRRDQEILVDLQGRYPDGPDRESLRVSHRERAEETELKEGEWFDLTVAAEQQF